MTVVADVIVVGSGAAGLFCALTAAAGARVVVLTKRAATDSSSFLAQGGIAAVVGSGDSIEKHYADTLRTGAGLCHTAVARSFIEEGPGLIRAMSRLGVAFSRTREGALDLGREGGHSERRIAHIDDFTGMRLVETLLARVRENPAIRLVEDSTVIDLVDAARLRGGARRCVGCYALDNRTGRVETYVARDTVIAAGGAGKVYLYTSNPDTACGDGIAMAYRAGVPIENMEFFQFHPTCLYHPQSKGFLISEALRGEGGKLRRIDGAAFMDACHPDGELAPRDIVARAIDDQLKRTGDDYVHLDMTALPPDFVRSRFPNIHARCLRLGIDMTARPIPVVPAAHYTCGGIAAGTDGATGLPGLSCIGESACTGFHGANRLASNSLLEGLAMARRCGEAVLARAAGGDDGPRPGDVPPWNPGGATRSHETVVVSQGWDEIRRFMWNYVGIVRSDGRLARARKRLGLVREEIDEYYWDHIVSSDLIELRNIATVAHLIIESAAFRGESRGLHFTDDHPAQDDEAWRGDTVLRKGEPPSLRRIDGE